MELRQLELFVAVAEELHFGRAARRVHLSQPALTQAIARFERRLDAQLFDRTSRRVNLTPAGAALVDRARALLADADSVTDLVARTARGELGVVRLGVVGTAMLELLPALVRNTRAVHPELELQLSEATGARQLEDLRAGRLDLGVLHADAAEPPAGVELQSLYAEPLAVALPADHPLATHRALRLAELQDERLVLIAPEREADTSSMYLKACARAGFSPKIAAHVTSLQALLGFVAAGLGWAFVAQSVVENLQRDHVTYVALRGTTLRLPTSIAWPTG
ncbi:MAG: LysR family transcriptional regulator, partial [Solirubrobacteraceae bacterium]|nr:LysR family transcriptional regulator [Solirubrobacteraceae bacterium]